MKNMTKFGIILSLSASAFAFAGCGGDTSPTAHTASAPVVMVDQQIALEKHPKTADAQETMRQEYEKIRNQVEETQGLPPEEKQKKIAEFQTKLQNLEKETFTPIQQETEKAINDVMKEKGASAVIDKRAVVSGGIDITKDVLVKEGLSADEADKIMSEAKNQQ